MVNTRRDPVMTILPAEGVVAQDLTVDSSELCQSAKDIGTDLSVSLRKNYRLERFPRQTRHARLPQHASAPRRAVSPGGNAHGVHRARTGRAEGVTDFERSR